MQWRQGDVLIQRIEGLPEGTRPRSDAVLFHGEVTGHAHRLAPESDAAILEWENDLFLQIGARGGTLIHDEHGPIPLGPGAYRVWRQREWDPSSRLARSIAD
jgi:hypothetical protein